MSDAELAARHLLHHRALIIFPHPLCGGTRYDQDALRQQSHAGNKRKRPPSWLSCPGCVRHWIHPGGRRRTSTNAVSLQPSRMWHASATSHVLPGSVRQGQQSNSCSCSAGSDATSSRLALLMGEGSSGARCSGGSQAWTRTPTRPCSTGPALQDVGSYPTRQAGSALMHKGNSPNGLSWSKVA